MSRTAAFTATLASVRARTRLKPRRRPFWGQVAKGAVPITLGYCRRATHGPGSWIARRWDGRLYKQKFVAMADDHVEADGEHVLTFDQARARAATIFAERPRVALTVTAAAADYIADLRARKGRAAADAAETRLEARLIPALGARLIADLTASDLTAWRNALVNGDDAEAQRKSRDTANRILSMAKAVLNHAARTRDGLSDAAWRHVSAFKSVGRAREAHFTSEEVARLIDAARRADPHFADLVEAGFVTGARLGELTSATVADFDPTRATLAVDGKTGARRIALTRDGVELFRRLAGNRAGAAPLLPRADGEPWGPSHQARPMKAALKAAGLGPTATFYALRHSYVSRAIESGAPLLIVAKNLGTSVTMIERTYAHVIASTRSAILEQHAPRLRGIDGGAK